MSVSRRLSQYSKRANKHGHRKLLQNLISIDTSDPSVLQDLEPRDGLAIRANPLRADKEVELAPLGKTSSQEQAALRQRWLADNQRNATDNQSVANNKSDYDSEDEETYSENIKQEDEFQKEVDKILDRVSNLDFGDNVSNKDIQEQMNRYKEENKYLTGQLSQRSGLSNKSFKSHFSKRSHFSRKAAAN